jgi:predicted DNA binding protein
MPNAAGNLLAVSAFPPILDIDRSMVCKMRVWPSRDGWAYELTKLHPGAVITMISRLELGGDRTLSEMAIQSPEPIEWDKKLRTIKGVLSVAKVGSSKKVTHLRVICDDPWYVAFFHQLELMWLLPIIIVDGMFVWRVLGANENIQILVEELQRQSTRVEVDDMRPASTDSIVDVIRHRDDLVKALLAEPVGDQVPIGVPKDLVGMLDSSDSGEDTEEVKGPGEKLAICRLRVVVPEGHWLHDVSRKYPTAVFDIMANLDIENNERWTEARIRSISAVDWVTEIRAIKEVLLVQFIGTTGNSTSLRVKVRKDPLFKLMDTLNILWRLPSPVKNGVFSMVVTGLEKDIHKLLTAAKLRSLDVVVTAVYHKENAGGGYLTPRQNEVFSRAVAAGYFQVPRLITLTELAADMKIAGSTLSEMLAVVEKKLVEEFEQANPN